MKTLALGAIAAVLLFATPSFAQDVRIRAGEGGVSVRTDEGRPGWRGDRRPDRDRDSRRAWRGDGGSERVIIRDRRPDRLVFRERGCRTMTVRSERPNGTVTIRRERRCG